MSTGPIIIRESRPQQCDFCGKIAEVRPYGLKGECVCFQCGMKNEAAAKQAFDARLNGETVKRTHIEGVSDE